MRTSSKILCLSFLLFIAGSGCSDRGQASHGSTQRIVIQHQDSMSDIVNTMQMQQLLQMQRNQQTLDNLDRTMDRMRGTMGRFGRTVNSANRMRCRR